MDPFKAVLARQKFNSQRSSEIQSAQMAVYQQTPAQTNHAPVEQPPSVGYSYEQVEQSNNLITMNCYRAEMLSAGVLAGLPADMVQLYSDGVFRLHRMEHGILKQIPVYIQMQ